MWCKNQRQVDTDCPSVDVGGRWQRRGVFTCLHGVGFRLENEGEGRFSLFEALSLFMGSH